MDELMNQQAQVGRSAEDTYSTIRGYIISAQNKVASAVNTAMVLTYHEIGEQMYKACGENDRAAYGKQLLQYLSERLTSEFGKGFNIRNLQMMRKFYVLFPNANTLCSELSWSHYRLLMRISDQAERQFYMEECSKSAWSVRQLERQIHTMSWICAPWKMYTSALMHLIHNQPAILQRLLWLLRYRQQSQSRNMKRSSKIPM